MAQVKMPKLGESVTEGTMGRWLKQVGDTVGKYEALAEVVTDKVNAEIPSDYVGVLTEILVGEGETVAVGVPIAVIREAGDAAGEVSEAAGTPDGARVTSPQHAPDAASAPGVKGSATQASPAGEVSRPADADKVASEIGRGPSASRFSPAVLRLAQERGLNLAQIQGTGLGGRVTRKDVLAQGLVQKGRGSDGRTGASADAEGEEPLTGGQAGAGASADVGSGGSAASAEVTDAEGTRIPLTAVRKTIARRMLESKQTAPHAWMMVEVDATSLVRLRERQKAAFKAKEGIDLTFLPFFIKAAVEALKEFPMVNSQWAGDHILQKREVNISIAVATPDALAVPVIHRADKMSIYGLASAIADLAQRARAGRLTLDDVQGGTFTVNNTGAFGSILSQPIINAPQAAILSVEAIVRRPMVQADDSIAIRSMVNVCMSLDHRILDGWVAGQFMKAVKRLVEGYNEQTPLY
ncbi:MAG: dihydrolipoamide acetyltransferase family protein [Firmicutes bacterium]|nr:dihydrolipoamide acetyltransferase family protein [Bacillota bacterium]